MAGLGHEPATPAVDESPEFARRNARYGLVLFFSYLALYSVFVLLNAFRPDWMDVIVSGGVNLAVAYGLALIVVALGLALLYGWVCRAAPTPASEERT